MGEWMAIAQWHECEQMARPGIVFELRNSEGQSLITAMCRPTSTNAIRLEIAAGDVSHGAGAATATFNADASSARLTPGTNFQFCRSYTRKAD